MFAPKKCSPTLRPPPRTYTFTLTLAPIITSLHIYTKFNTYTNTKNLYVYTNTNTNAIENVYVYTNINTNNKDLYIYTKTNINSKNLTSHLRTNTTQYSNTSTLQNQHTDITITRELKGILTIFVHLCFEAFPKPACPALVAMGLVYGTVSSTFPLLLADVDSAPVDASLEETTAPITGVNTVVLPRAAITAYFTRNVEKAITCRKKREREKSERLKYGITGKIYKQTE